MCYNFFMDEKILKIKKWLGTGSINIFGLPMSGKDTQGLKLTEILGAKFLSSGMIIREMETKTNNDMSGSGKLIPTDVFYDWVLPYFGKPELAEFPLVLSSIGRWSGEENQIIESTSSAGHEIKAVIILELSEEEAIKRFNVAKTLNDRGERSDDKDESVFRIRLDEFREKTLPVLEHYDELGLLVRVNGCQSREAVFEEIVEKLAEKAS